MNNELVCRWRRLHDEVSSFGATMIAVSKYHADDDVAQLAQAGQIDFGESRPQALRDRAQRFPNLHWHMIGPVQKNKARYIARHAFMWHSVSCIEVAAEVAKHLNDRMLPVLIQVNISGEKQKYGIAPEQVDDFLKSMQQFKQLNVVGLMGMAVKRNPESEQVVRESFRMLGNLRDKLGDASLGELCMGMSGDYRIAIEEGATMVRLGTVLFGARAKE